MSPTNRPLRLRCLQAGLLILALLALAGLRVGAAQAAGVPAPSALRIDGLERPADLGDLQSPTFSWHVNSREQSAYEVSLSQAGGDAGAGDVWSSGKVDSRQQTDVPYTGPALEPERRYTWVVRTWNEAGEVSGWSDATWFGTAPGASWEGSTPIWAAATPDTTPTTTKWTDYTLTAKVKVTAVALGVRFRAADASNSYMWQLRGADNRLQKHKQVKGTYTATESVALPDGTLAVGKTVQLKITVKGATITTWIDGTEVDKTTDASYAQGTVGFRNGSSESGEVDDLKVVDDTDGSTLIDDDFSGANPFTCGTVAGGVLAVGKGVSCVLPNPDGTPPVSTQWAFLRKQAHLQDKPIAWASAFATGVDFTSSKQYVYKLYVNGSFVGLGPTRQIGGETRYDGFDVTSLLRSGDDVTIAAQAYSRASTPKFLAQLRIVYTDGTTQTIGTGTDWKATHGTRILPEAGSIGTSYYSAPKENLDARRYPFGFDQNGFDDSAWAAAVEQPAIADLQPAPMGKVQEQLRDPVKIVDKGDGDYFVDFGRTWAGGVQYDVADGTAGDQVSLRFGEVPTTTGGTTVRYRTEAGNDYEDVVTLKDGGQRIKTWGMRVFRYLEITGAKEPVTKENLKALALVYPFDENASSFTSSDAGLDQVYGLAKNTIESLNQNFYTDSWTRERTNYEADGYLQQLSSLYLMDDLSLGRYSMNYFKSNRTWPTEWPIFVVLAVHDAWRQTGSVEQVREYYDNLKTKLPAAWLESSTGLVKKSTGVVGTGSCNDCDIVDWPTSQRDGYKFAPYNTVVNAIYYRAMSDMAAMATAIGRDDEAADYTAKAERLRAQINARLYDETSGRYDDGMSADGTPTGHYALQASAFALAFGVPEQGRQAQRVADYVDSRGMACSVYCGGFVVQGLFEGGNGAAALRALNGTGTSSWRHMIDLGAGSTMEAWDPSQKSNLTYSHPWAASPAFNVPAGLFGIQPIEAGYATFRVRPQPGTLDHAAITVPTVKGTIGVAFDHGSDGDLRLAADVPGNTRADVSIPTDSTAATLSLYVDGERTEAPVDAGFATIKALPTGCHVISTRAGYDAYADPPLTTVCAAEPEPRNPVTATVAPPETDGWLPGGAKLELAAPADAGIDAVEYRIGDGEWTTYSGPVALPDGEVAVSYRGRSGQRTSAATTRTFRVDATPPTVIATTIDRTVALDARDAGSGVASVAYRVDDGPWAPYTAAIALDGRAHTVRYRATDLVGNASSEGATAVAAAPDGPAAAPRATRGPRIVGRPRAGRILRVTPGTWDVPGVRTTVRWTRDGAPIAGAHGATLRLGRTDVGARIGAVVTAQVAGRPRGASVAASTKRVEKARSVTRASRSASAVRNRSVVSLRIRVRAAGLSPTGRVQVFDRGRLARTVRLTSGRASVRLRLSRPGRHTIVAAYAGDGGIRASSTRTAVSVR